MLVTRRASAQNFGHCGLPAYIVGDACIYVATMYTSQLVNQLYCKVLCNGPCGVITSIRCRNNKTTIYLAMYF